MKKNSRVAIAQDTLQILEQGFYQLPSGAVILLRTLQNFAEDHTLYYAPESLDKSLATWQASSQNATAYEVIQQTTLEGLLMRSEQTSEKIGILNFASAKNAGGGFLNGAQAQEESLARSSGLYPCLLKAPLYYDTHRNMKSCLYTDSMIYSPQVPFFKDDAGAYLPKVYLADVLTSPAVNAGVVRQRESENQDYILPTMRQRMEKVLMLFAENNCKHLILGAWGCGVFQNLPTEIATLFEACFVGKFRDVFKTVLFSIKSDNPAMIAPFQKRFS